jgi:hypothetical protein
LAEETTQYVPAPPRKKLDGKRRVTLMPQQVMRGVTGAVLSRETLKPPISAVKALKVEVVNTFGEMHPQVQ